MRSKNSLSGLSCCTFLLDRVLSAGCGDGSSVDRGNPSQAVWRDLFPNLTSVQIPLPKDGFEVAFLYAY